MSTFEKVQIFIGVAVDWNSLLSGLVGAIVGGLIAAFSTMWAANKGAERAFNYSRTLQDEADREALRRLLLAIRAEVETVWNGYQLEVGRLVESLKDGEGLALIYKLIYKLRQQYFTVYDSNAQYLGHVENDELRAAIVRTYTLAKGLIDTHLVNNDLLFHYNNVAELDLKTYSAVLQQNQQRTKRDWQAFGVEIKTAYRQTKESVTLLLRLLNESELLEKK
jgi:hypothetical protein